MTSYFRTLIALFSLLLLSCGSSSGNDPHLSIEEQQDALEINLVGKWKIRRLQPLGSSKNSLTSDCSIDEIEFFEEGDYICKSQNYRCNHFFHRHCGTEWFVRKPTCPCCRLFYLVIVPK